MAQPPKTPPKTPLAKKLQPSFMEKIEATLFSTKKKMDEREAAKKTK